MRNKYDFSNVVGMFIFNEHINPIKSILFTDDQDFAKGNVSALSERELPDPKALDKILSFFRKKEYYAAFRERNIFLTKAAVHNSVSVDVLIIQAIHHIGDIDKVSNVLAKRLREWYEWYNPELSRRLVDHAQFVNAILEGKSKKEPDTMGADLGKADLEPIRRLAEELSHLFALRAAQEIYLENLMRKNCPNLLTLTGTTLGAKLLAQAGSLKRMVMLPASTIQLLGAEKALFRHIKSGARSPKYGFLHEHPYVGTCKKEFQGKAARILADKISIAAKVDYFKGDFIGEKLLRDLEKKKP